MEDFREEIQEVQESTPLHPFQEAFNKARMDKIRSFTPHAIISQGDDGSTLVEFPGGNVLLNDITVLRLDAISVSENEIATFTASTEDGYVDLFDMDLTKGYLEIREVQDGAFHINYVELNEDIVSNNLIAQYGYPKFEVKIKEDIQASAQGVNKNQIVSIFIEILPIYKPLKVVEFVVDNLDTAMFEASRLVKELARLGDVFKDVMARDYIYILNVNGLYKVKDITEGGFVANIIPVHKIDDAHKDTEIILPYHLLFNAPYVLAHEEDIILSNGKAFKDGIVTGKEITFASIFGSEENIAESVFFRLDNGIGALSQMGSTINVQTGTSVEVINLLKTKVEEVSALLAVYEKELNYFGIREGSSASIIKLYRAMPLIASMNQYQEFYDFVKQITDFIEHSERPPMFGEEEIASVEDVEFTEVQE